MPPETAPDPAEDAESLRIAIREAREAAHDVNQPLTIILARSQLLLAKSVPESPEHRALTIIVQEAERLAAAIQKLQSSVRRPSSA